MKIKMNLRRLVIMRMLGIQSKKMVGVSLGTMVEEAWLEVGLLLTQDVSWLLIGGWWVIRPPLREDMEVRLWLEMVGAGVAII